MAKKSSIFTDALITATRKAFSQVKESHRGEHFYAFALYTTENADYFLPSCNTEEGLECRAKEYTNRSGSTLEECKRQLRWNAADWAYHLQGKECFAEVEQLIQRFTDDTDRKILIRSAIDALRQLDKEGLFGTGSARDKVIVNLLAGDESNDGKLRSAKKLNLASAYQRLADDIEVKITEPYFGIGTGRPYSINDMKLSHDGNSVAAAGDKNWVWTVPDGIKQFNCPVKDSFGSVALSPDGSILVTNWIGSVRGWSVAAKKEVWTLPHPDHSRFVSFSPNGEYIVAATESKNCDNSLIHIWRTSGEKLQTLNVNAERAMSIAVSPDNKSIAVGTMEGTLAFFEILTGQMRYAVKACKSVDTMAFTPDGTCIISGGDAFRTAEPIRIFDARTGALHETMGQPKSVKDGISALALSGDGKMVATGHHDGSVRLWNLATHQLLLRLQTKYESFGGLAFTPNGGLLLASGHDVGSLQSARTAVGSRFYERDENTIGEIITACVVGTAKLRSCVQRRPLRRVPLPVQPKSLPTNPGL